MIKEVYPLAWPVGWPRTPIKERMERKAWKKTERQSIEALELELTRYKNGGKFSLKEL